MPTISSTCHLSPYWSTFTLAILSIIFPPSPQLNSLLPVSLHNFLFSFSFSSSFQSTVISSLFFHPSPFADHSFPFFYILPTFAYWQSFLSRQSFIPSISLPSFLHLFLLLQPLLSNSIPLFLTRFITSVLLLPSFFYHSIPFFLPPLPSHQTLSIFLFHLTSVLPCFLCYNSAFFLVFSFLLAPILFSGLCNSLEPPLISLFCLQEPRPSCNFWSGFELWFSRLSQEHSKVFWH